MQNFKHFNISVPVKIVFASMMRFSFGVALMSQRQMV